MVVDAVKFVFMLTLSWGERYFLDQKIYSTHSGCVCVSY